MTAMARALVTGLFLTQAINPVYAGLFDFKLGAAIRKRPVNRPGLRGRTGHKGRPRNLKNAISPTARWPWSSRRMP